MSLEGYGPDTLQQFVGRELGVSEWLVVDQSRIDRFADCTGDRQWIHVDVERAGKESPLGSTIAHGYLTLSLLSCFSFEVGVFPPGARQVINYGLDKVRFLSPVRAGARVRDRIVLLAVQDKGDGRTLLKAQHTVEIEGEERPALVAETLGMTFAG
jgi:acyl dehydratase